MRIKLRLKPAIAFLTLLLLCGAVQAQESAETFLSSGKKIRVESFVPADSVRHPAVLLLYGASGLTGGAEGLHKYGHSLADHGYAAFLVRYFDATASDTAGKLPVDEARFRLWTRTIEDTVTYVSRDSHVDSRHIGAVGFSLGAFLALWESSQDPRIKALAEYYGGINMFLGPAKRMPATLILHGEKDSVVPVEEARKLERLLQDAHAPYEIKIYPGQEHGFDGPDGGPAASEDAWQHTLAFFGKYLDRH